MIPDGQRLTACVSSQVGCPVQCKFCASGIGGVKGNLTAGQIVEQVIRLNQVMNQSDEATKRRSDEGRNVPGRGSLVPRITNIVFMGMGEPLANFRAVVPAIRIFLDDLGFDISRRRVTLSTSGLVPQIYKLAEEVNCALAVSLHAPNDELRSQLVPINRKHNIAELLDACWHYLDEQNGRSVTFEYVMLDGVNDQPAHARELARLLRDKPAKLNLIPFNPFPGTAYRRSPAAAIEKFRDELMQRGIIVTIRKTRGEDIDAACGQLAGQVTDRTIVRLGSKTFGLQVRV
jgi:23S rRNA (adenine2503-C2)-methyltransferase